MRKCEICGKGSRMVGKRKLLRGHYNPTNWSRKYPNLQSFTNKKGEKVLACTSCMRNDGKEARIEANKAQRIEEAKKKVALAEKRKAEKEAKAKKAEAQKAQKAKAKEKKATPKKK